MPSSTPYRCLACMQEGACGFHGVLVFDNELASKDFHPPVCRHNEKPARGSQESDIRCHPEPVVMVPSR